MLSKLTWHRVKKFCTTASKMSPVKRGLNLAFGKYLLTTNIVSSGVLMAVGDIVQQEIEYQRNMLPERYDISRLTRMTLVGLAFGPMHHYFYTWLNTRLPKRDFISISKKVLYDQFLMSPACIVTFFYGMGILEQRKMKNVNQELKEKFVEVYVMDWTIWPVTQFVNFYFVPFKYQVFYINAVTMLYNVFLSYIKHREVANQYFTELSASELTRS